MKCRTWATITSRSPRPRGARWAALGPHGAPGRGGAGRVSPSPCETKRGAGPGLPGPPRFPPHAPAGGGCVTCRRRARSAKRRAREGRGAPSLLHHFQKAGETHTAEITSERHARTPRRPGGDAAGRGGAPREPSLSPPSACGVCPAGPLPGPAPRPPPLSPRLKQNALSCSPRQTGEGPSRPDGTPGGLRSIHTPPGGLGGPGAERTAPSARLQPTQVTVNRELSKTRADHGDLRILRMRTPPNTMWGPVNAS